MSTEKHKLNFWMLLAFIIGNVLGSGIFMLPANLARIGSISIFSWIFTAIGSILLAIVFSKMSSLITKVGGPYAFAHSTFGEFMGFQTAYTYWISLWLGSASLVIAFIGYLQVFFPSLANPKIGTLVAIIFVWLMTLMNLRGARSVGYFQIVTTLLKFIPLLIILFIAVKHFNPGYVTSTFNISGKSNFAAFSYAATLTLWSFVGLECGTVPAGSVINPQRNIPLATMIGVGLIAILYIVTGIAMMGLLPAATLANSTSPFAAATAIVFGDWGKWIVAGGAVIASLGALNSQTMLQSQVAMAAAQDRLFPKIFAMQNKASVPTWSLLITSVLVTIFLIFSARADLIDEFQFAILIATTSTLIAYLYTSVAKIIVLAREKRTHAVRVQVGIALLAMLYVFWAIFGSGKDIVFYLFLFLLSSLPLYALLCWRRKSGIKCAKTQEELL